MSCAVKECKNYKARRKEGISFFRFPREEYALNLWKQAIGLDENWTRSRNKYVCSEHFTPEDFLKNRVKRGGRTLDPYAVPSLLLGGYSYYPKYMTEQPRSSEVTEFIIIELSEPSTSNASILSTDTSVNTFLSTENTSKGEKRKIINTSPARIKAKNKRVLEGQQKHRQKLYRVIKQIKNLKKQRTSLKLMVKCLKKRCNSSQNISRKLSKYNRYSNIKV